MNTDKYVYVVSLKVTKMTEVEYNQSQNSQSENNNKFIVMNDGTFLVNVHGNNDDAHLEVYDILMELR